MKVRRDHYELPDKDCERLTAPEMEGVRWCLNMASTLLSARDDLKKRLKCVPYGNQRMNMITGGMNSLFQDILGTVTDKQRRNLRNTARDYMVKLVPSVRSDKRVLAIEKRDFKTLVNAAKEKCRSCTECGLAVRKCPLYQILEVYVPLDEYDDTIACSYAYQEWKEDEKV